MLEEFSKDVLKGIDARINNEISKLIATDGDNRHDLTRGQIMGLKAAADEVRTVLTKFGKVELGDEEIASAYNTPQTPAGRHAYYRGGPRA